MPKLNLVERKLNRFLRDPPSVRGAMGVIVVATVMVVVVGGALMRFIDHNEYSSIWVGMWWAIQTVTTVGYGDVTPENPAGRIVATVLMLEASRSWPSSPPPSPQRSSSVPASSARPMSGPRRGVSTHALTNSKRAWSGSRSRCGEPCLSNASGCWPGREVGRGRRYMTGGHAGATSSPTVDPWRRWDSNPQPPPCKGGALPVAPRPRSGSPRYPAKRRTRPTAWGRRIVSGVADVDRGDPPGRFAIATRHVARRDAPPRRPGPSAPNSSATFGGRTHVHRSSASAAGVKAHVSNPWSCSISTPAGHSAKRATVSSSTWPMLTRTVRR